MDRPKIELDSEGIVVVDFGVLMVTPDLFRYVMARQRQLAPNQKSRIMLVLQGATEVQGEILKISESREVTEFTGALAIVALGKVARALGDLFLKIHNTSYPISLFESEPAAREWLLSSVQGD